MTDALSTERHIIILRLAPEIMLKSAQTRKKFIARLKASLHAVLSANGIDARLKPMGGRLMMLTTRPEAAVKILPTVFGIASFSAVDAAIDGDMDAVVATAHRLYADTIGGRTYAVRAKVHGQRRFGSLDLAVRIGSALNPYGKVDLERPEITVRVDVQDGITHFYTETANAAGGLPLGTQGRALSLISGGFDSAVSSWLMMRRGVVLDFLFCNLAGAAYEHMVVQVTKLLCDRWAVGMAVNLHVVDFQPVIDDLRAKTHPEMWQVLLKRLMLRAANAIGGRIRAEAVVTGEAIGQVSSQTLSNLNSIDAASRLPVLRPLIATDKADIIALARRIGTADISEKVQEYCALNKYRPAVRTGIGRCEREEAHLDPAVLETALAAARVIDIAALTSADLAEPYVFVDAFPEDAVILDCQPDALHEQWHVAGARHVHPSRLALDFDRLDKNRRYVLYCHQGTSSALLAELMQQAGYEAYALRGDLRAVKQAAGVSGEAVAAEVPSPAE